jgi:hypothetical protein
MTTSKRVAPKASKEPSKKSTKDQKSVAGSDLAQMKPGKKKK